MPDALAAHLVQVVRGLRELDLRKAPSISETIDWARTLAVLGVDELSGRPLGHRLRGGQVLADVRSALDALPPLMDPNAAVADGPAVTARARPRAQPRPRTTTAATHDDDHGTRPGGGRRKTSPAASRRLLRDAQRKRPEPPPAAALAAGRRAL